MAFALCCKLAKFFLSRYQQQLILIDSVLCVVIAVMRIKVEQTVVSGEDLKIVATNKRKLYRTSAAMKSKEVSLIVDCII
jgi:hypothetical protein